MEAHEQFPQESGENARRAAGEKLDRYGDLGVTAEDHMALGSTPDEELAENPGKTLGQIWSDEKIAQFLTDLKLFINSKAEGGLIKYQEMQKNNYEATLHYLKGIDRLPKGFLYKD